MGILGHGYHGVRIACHVQDRDARACYPSGVIQRITLPFRRFLFAAEAVHLHHPARIFCRPFGSALSHRPAGDVHHRCIRIDARYLVRVLRRPVVDDQSPAAHALEHRLAMESVFPQIAVEPVPALRRLVRSVEVGHVAADDVESLFQQVDVRLRLMPPETCAPHPGPSFRFPCRADHLAVRPFRAEVISPESVETESRSPFRHERRLPSLFPGEQVIAHLACDHPRTDGRRMQAVGHERSVPSVAEQVEQVDDAQSALAGQLFHGRSHFAGDLLRADGSLLGQEAAHGREHDHLRMRRQVAVSVRQPSQFGGKRLCPAPVLRPGVVGAQFQKYDVGCKLLRPFKFGHVRVRIIPPRSRRGPVMSEVLHPVSLARQLLQLRRIRIVLSACNARTISDAVAHAGHFQGLLRADYGRKDQQETKNQNLPHVIFSLKIKKCDHSVCRTRTVVFNRKESRMLPVAGHTGSAFRSLYSDEV